MLPSISFSTLQPKPSLSKKRIPPFYPDIDEQTGPAELTKKLRTSMQPSELFADVADSLFSHYSDIGNMKKTFFPIQSQFLQILEEYDFSNQSQCSSFEQSSNLSFLLNSSGHSSLQNSAKKSQKGILVKEESETASQENSFAAASDYGDKKIGEGPKKILRFTQEDKKGFCVEKRLEFSEKPSPYKVKKSLKKKDDVSLKQDELQNRLDDMMKQAQSLLDTMKETVEKAANETPNEKSSQEFIKMTPIKCEAGRFSCSQKTDISENKIKIEPKIEQEGISHQIALAKSEHTEPVNDENAINSTDNNYDRKENNIVNMRIGEAYQADVIKILQKKNQQTHETKLIWDPEKCSEEELEKYQKGLKKIIKGELICEAKALKVLTKSNGNVEKALKEIQGNSRYYISQLKMSVRSLRSQNPNYWGLANQDEI